MSGHAPFLHEIVSSPANLDARRIYADWLIEQGDARGEFIQLFFELEGKISGKRRAEIKRQLKQEIKVQTKRDYAQSPAIKKLRNPEYRHGFIEHATIGMTDFVKFGSEICSFVPLRSVSFTSGAKQIPNLVKCDHLKSIDTIDFHGNKFSDPSFAEFADCPFIGNLNSLRVRGSAIGIETAKRLSKGKSLSLSSFSVSFANLWDNPCSKQICESDNFAALEHLKMEGVPIGKESAKHVSQSGFRDSLRSLDLSFCNISDDGFEHLVSEPKVWPRLERLVLNECNLTDRCLDLLTHKDHREKFPALTYLGLNFNLIGDQGLIALANSVLLRQLTNVRMSQNHLSLDGLLALGGSKHRNPKTEFYLAKNRIRGGQLSHLIKQYGDFGKFTA